MNKKGDITPAGAKRLIKLLKSREGIFAEHLKDKELTNEDVEYFMEKYKRFVEFLNTAIADKETISCSC